MIDERVGEAYELEEQLTVVGRKLDLGEIALDFTLDHYNGEAIRSVALADSDGSVRVLNVVNSLDTPICDVETRRWEQLRSELPEGVVVLTISMDLAGLGCARSWWEPATVVAPVATPATGRRSLRAGGYTSRKMITRSRSY